MQTLKVGQQVIGDLFDGGTVLALGTAQSLRRHDSSSACAELTSNTPCVAVKLPDDSVAVYVESEVYAKDVHCACDGESKCYQHAR